MDKFYGPDLINKYLKYKSLREIVNLLKNYRKNPETQNKYHMLMIYLAFRLNKLDTDMKNMSKDEVKNEKLDQLKDLVNSIVNYNQNLDDFAQLETEEDAAQRQRGQGLKIMTPSQLIIRLKNSQKIKN